MVICDRCGVKYKHVDIDTRTTFDGEGNKIDKIPENFKAINPSQ